MEKAFNCKCSLMYQFVIKSLKWFFYTFTLITSLVIESLKIKTSLIEKIITEKWAQKDVNLKSLWKLKLLKLW